MEKIKYSNVEISDGFWKKKRDMVKNTTIDAVYNRFFETHRFDAFQCDWKEGDENKPHIYWDSDVAKWIEGVSYFLKEKRDERLEKIIDDVVDLIVKNADENGYYNSYFLVVNPSEKFTNRDCHELYCLGHLIEAAIAYNDATGKDKFLKAMCKYTDYVEKVFMIEKSAKFITPGHPELELALVKLYEATNEKRYLKLAEFFIDEHGKNGENLGLDWTEDSYNQDNIPLKERKTPEGHAVRAMYLMCGAASVAEKTGDKDLLYACERVFDSIVNKRMYITGGIGSSHIGEAFTVDYHLPNRTAYAETCAAIALAMFSMRMQNIVLNSKYADTVERVIYNGFLSGVSMGGDAFFYENPLETDPMFNEVNPATKWKERFPITERKKVFSCSCCPPNVVRFVPSIAEYIYSLSEDCVCVHQYIASSAKYEGIEISQETSYPENGKVKIKCSIGNRKLALRIPGWCENFNINKEYKIVNGYAIIDDANEVVADFDMPVIAMHANRKVHPNAGRIAIMHGPVVYCAEGVDNGSDIKCAKLDLHGEYTLVESEFLLPSIKTTAYIEEESDLLYSKATDEYKPFEFKLIPYYAFANRGTTEMQVWFLMK